MRVALEGQDNLTRQARIQMAAERANMTTCARVIAGSLALVARFGLLVGQSGSPNTFLLFLRLENYRFKHHFLFFDELQMSLCVLNNLPSCFDNMTLFLARVFAALKQHATFILARQIRLALARHLFGLIVTR